MLAGGFLDLQRGLAGRVCTEQDSGEVQRFERTTGLDMGLRARQSIGLGQFDQIAPLLAKMLVNVAERQQPLPAFPRK